MESNSTGAVYRLAGKGVFIFVSCHRNAAEYLYLCKAALCADGTTVVKDAEELKVKESNRIATMSTELGKMGVVITETEDGYEYIEGKGQKNFKKGCYCG